jgi:hypothetical protein
MFNNNFKRIAKENPYLSTLMVFNETVRTGRYTVAEINKRFDKLVEKSDYPRSVKDTLLEHAYALNMK